MLNQSKSPENVLVIPELHFRKKQGGEDRRSIDAVLKYASDQKFSHCVFLGDILDNNSISSHNKGLLKSVEGETILRDYEVANKSLDEFESATRGATKVVIEGNHDYRTAMLVNQQPQLEGLIETPNGLQLKRRGWLWVPYWSRGTIYSLGKASFIHGRYTNDLHSKKHALAYGRNIYYGHTHTFQNYTVEREGDNNKFEAASLGCLCEYQQEYLKGRPTKWQQGFCVFRFQPNGFFNRYEVRIFQHRFISPEGKLYRG